MSQLNPLPGHYVYGEIGLEPLHLLGRSFYAYLTFGHPIINCIFGTVTDFTDTLSVINELSSRGWELTDVCVLAEGNDGRIDSYKNYILKKRFGELPEDERAAYGR